MDPHGGSARCVEHRWLRARSRRHYLSRLLWMSVPNIAQPLRHPQRTMWLLQSLSSFPMVPTTSYNTALAQRCGTYMDQSIAANALSGSSLDEARSSANMKARNMQYKAHRGVVIRSDRISTSKCGSFSGVLFLRFCSKSRIRKRCVVSSVEGGAQSGDCVAASIME
jgi:hypothetical protein